MKTDVVVIGAGGAGVNAAIAAADGRAKVVVVDTSDNVGGTARIAGGGTCLAGSSRQRELGIEDSVDLALDDWMAVGGPDADAGWAQRYLEASAGSLGSQLAELGVRWGDVQWKEGNTVPRWHAPIGGGRAVMGALESEARRQPRIDWLLGTRVTTLSRQGGAIVGVAAMGPNDMIELRATSVIVATGGFNSSADKIREHARAAADVPTILLGGGPGARGFGHDLLFSVGAGFVNLDALWMYAYGLPDHESDEGRGLAVRGIDGDVWINRSGDRFHDESLRGGATGTPALLSQPGATAWSIIDRRLADRLTVADPRYREGVTPDRVAIERLLRESPHIRSAHDLSTLAQEIEVDESRFVTTIREHNVARRRGDGHDEFGRCLEGLAPLDSPPFFALRFLPLARKNLGGVRTDADGQVLDGRGAAIPGLFAAGEVAGMAGGCINGRGALEGTMFGPSLFSGSVAGHAVIT